MKNKRILLLACAIGVIVLIVVGTQLKWNQNAQEVQNDGNDMETMRVQEQYGLYPGQYKATQDTQKYKDMDVEQVAGSIKKDEIVHISSLSEQNDNIFGLLENEENLWVMIEQKQTPLFEPCK